MVSAEDWIARLDLAPHPEGGWFRRIYTDPRRVPVDGGERAAATSIHYLLTREAPQGRLHRNRSTILHYLQDGGPIDYWLLDATGGPRRVTLGVEPGHSLFFAVPGGTWKGTRLVDGAAHALVAEVVLPGFDFADHEFMSSGEFDALHPEHRRLLADFVA